MDHVYVSRVRVLCPQTPDRGELGLEGFAVSRWLGYPVCSLCGEEL